MKKKILFITHSSASAGGAEDEFERLLKFFSKKNDIYELHGIFPDGPRKDLYSSFCARAGTYKQGHLPVIYENFFDYVKYLIKSLIQIYQICRFTFGYKYDISVINVVVLIWPALLMSFKKSKVIVFIREDIYPVKLRHLVYRLLSKTCTFFIPNSITKEKNFISVTNDHRIKHIYPGIENDLNDSQSHKLENVIGEEFYRKISEKNIFKFVNPAGVIVKKNQLLILEALNEIRKSGNQIIPYVFFVGFYFLDSPYVKKLLKYIEEKSLNEFCFFLGPLERHVLYELYQLIDATILSSLSEGMPIVLIESFKFKKPVISTKVGGIPEIIEDSVNGFLVNFDEKQLGRTMVSLMQNRNLYNEVRSRAYSTYTEKFNLDTSLKEIESIFKRLM